MAIPARRMNSLPTPSSMLAIQIVQAAVRPNITVTELVTLCQNDPTVVGRLLAYVNGSGFGLNRRVSSVAHAVSLLGIRGTRNLALATCVSDMAPGGEEGDAILTVCLRRAVAAKLLAEKLGHANPDDFFTLGLLMEVGLLVKARTDLRAAAELARSPAATRITLERAAGQEDHAKLANRLARAWVVDLEMSAALLHHHDKEPAKTAFGIAAWLSEHLAGVFESHDVLQTRRAALEAGAAVGVSGEDVDALLKRIPETLLETGAFFERNVGPQPDIEALVRDANAAILELNRNYHEVLSNLEAVLKEKERLVSELEQASEKLSSLALTDSLTNLANGRAFHEALARDVARADRQSAVIAILVVDIDDLRRVNELHSQSVGDAALLAVSQILVQATRVSDLVARLSADEFALILPNTDVPGAKIVAERIRKTTEDYEIETPNGPIRVTVSLGLTMTKGPGCRGREQALFDAAAQALLIAKQSGKNRLQIGSL
jgi:two-component system, cell cycle response regulator